MNTSASQRPYSSSSPHFASAARRLALVIAAATTLVPLSACARSKPARSYQATGEIRTITEGGKKALIKHDAIAGYMMAMTMEFNVKDPAEVKSLQPGDLVRFRLVPTADSHWIDQIVKTGTAKPATAPPAAPAPSNGPRSEAKVGDLLPDVELVGEDGKRFKLSSLRGKAVAFTFIFTRCPLPDYCPRMSNNFASARQLLVSDKSAPANWQLLSISFDPGHDTPDVLTKYGNALRANDPTRWLFAAAPAEALHELAPRLDLMVKATGDSFDHNLRTVVLDGKGRIHKQFDGNEWTPKELAAAIVEAARAK